MNKTIIKALMMILPLMSAVACNSDFIQERGEGYLQISLQRDDDLDVKALSSPEEGQIFAIQVYTLDGALVNEVADHRELDVTPMILTSGKYKVKASSGKATGADFDAPYYTGEAEIVINADRTTTAEIVCTIANVKVTVSFSDEIKEKFSDYGVTVSNTLAGLTFSKAAGTIDREGWLEATGILTWNLSVTNMEGKTSYLNDTYTNVQPRQHYALSFSLAEQEETGGMIIRLTVDDEMDVKEYDFVLDFGEKTNVDAGFEGVDNPEEIYVTGGDQSPKAITLAAESGLQNVVLSLPEVIPTKAAGAGNVQYELVDANETTVSLLNSLGIEFEPIHYGATSAKIDITGYVSSLATGSSEIGFKVTDTKGTLEEYSWTLNILSDTEADPIAAYPSVTTARVSAKWFAGERPAGLGIEYRKAEEASWTKVADSALTFDDSAKTVTAELTGLTAGTEYSFRPYTDANTDIRAINFTTSFAVRAIAAEPWAKFAIVKGEWLTMSRPSGLSFKYRKSGSSVWTAADPSFVEFDEITKTFTSELRGLSEGTSYEFCATSDLDADANNLSVSFTTAGTPTLYNMSFDEWYQSGKVWYPYAEGANPSIWDSANPGAANFIGSSTTPESADVAVSGSEKYSARMESKYALIAFAAGNIYTGKFKEINMSTQGAILDWGVPFNGKPVALKGYYKYAPKAIDKAKAPYESMIGTMDKCQFQIILTDWTEPFTINTSAGIFVDLENDPSIIAYGKFESDVTTDGFVEFTLPVEYRDTSRTPSYIIITCCASYLGDYFTGGVGSLLLVDELSFEYDLNGLTAEEASKVNYR
ncbi:MAG: DUF4493 domain-containing protein [Candidatus Cryptobacteroides sp.]